MNLRILRAGRGGRGGNCGGADVAWGFWAVDDSGYRRFEDGAALPRPAARRARRWLPGVTLLAAVLMSAAIWAGIVLAAIRLWRWL